MYLYLPSQHPSFAGIFGRFDHSIDMTHKPWRHGLRHCLAPVNKGVAFIHEMGRFAQMD
jgi:hypothetical protein